MNQDIIIGEEQNNINIFIAKVPLLFSHGKIFKMVQLQEKVGPI